MGAPQLDRRRLLHVAALFQSPHDGERLAALEAFSRTLQAGGASWADLIEQPGKPAPDNAKIDGEAAPKPLSYADLARMGRGVLTDWEQRFLVGISTQRSLSPKQRRMLGDVRRKVETAEAVRAAGAAP